MRNEVCLSLLPTPDSRLSLSQLQEQALLSLKVCDPACGSGHFLLAAARRIGKELARVRTGETQPGTEPLRQAIRDVIQHCIYGVDLNPLAVDLCKVALWLEGLCRGLSLNFLDHRIKCGNSLVGVLDLDCLNEGIPDNAFKPVTGDDTKLASLFKKRNKQERESAAEGQLTLQLDPMWEQERDEYAKAWREIEGMKDDNPAAVRQKQAQYERSRQISSWLRDRSACNLWTAAFFMPLTEQNLQLLPTSAMVENLLKGNRAIKAVVDAADKLAEEKRFFHWCLEFPEVFEQGGFDCVLGNPPWERIKVQEKDFFAARNREIANASKADRKKLISALKKNNPKLAQAFWEAKHDADAQGKFLRESSRFLLTATGDINTYAVFTETNRKIVNPTGLLGCIVPPGIATDDSLKLFIQDLVNTHSISSFYDFTNRGYIFVGLESTHAFSLLTLSNSKVSRVDLAAQIWRVEDLKRSGRTYTLSKDEIRQLNPNTLNLPILRSERDADLIKRIYEGIPILVSESHKKGNPWGIKFDRMFDMTNDSNLFKKLPELAELGGYLQQNKFVVSKSVFLPLYEAKLTDIFNHRESTFEGILEDDKYGTRPRTNDATIELITDFYWTPIPRYWVLESEAESRIYDLWKHSWLIGFRNAISAVADSRSVRFTILPKVGVGNSMPLVYSDQKPTLIAALVANFNSLALDYVAKQKASGGNLNYYVLKQFPIISPQSYSRDDIEFIAPRVLELTYTAWDMQPFAQDMGYEGEPFIWDSNRRALLRAELDAYYAHLYGLTRDELRYILDPADVYGPDFPSETFRVLKNNEIKQFGEYRTQRLVLEAWDRLFGRG
ncbi:MAG TPA: hypothetical protein DDZ80_22355 [Cyanobacteria bacterium UBA8803]|nr:hypothetical protein [Cyanobacteria bacterium UBA8803]